MRKVLVLLLAGALVLNLSGTSLAARTAKHKGKLSSSAQVMKIQRDLKNAGYDPGPIDGKMGPKTKAAVEAFQKDNSLKVDGVVGPQTWAKLSTYSKSNHHAKK